MVISISIATRSKRIIKQRADGSRVSEGDVLCNQHQQYIVQTIMIPTVFRTGANFAKQAALLGFARYSRPWYHYTVPMTYISLLGHLHYLMRSLVLRQMAWSYTSPSSIFLGRVLGGMDDRRYTLCPTTATRSILFLPLCLSTFMAILDAAHTICNHYT